MWNEVKGVVYMGASLTVTAGWIKAHSPDLDLRICSSKTDKLSNIILYIFHLPF
jgi:hypothetical protein